MNIQEIFQDLKGLASINLTLGAVVRLAVLVVVGVVVIRLLLKITDRMLERSKPLASLKGYIRSVVKVGLWFLLAVMVADELGLPTASLVALLSVAGLSVSLALQNTLSNLAGGITLLVTKPFQVGDFVEADGLSGTVSSVDLAYTALLTVDNKEIFIPNSQLSATKIINYTASGKRRAELTFNASYEAPTQVVKDALREAVEAIPQILDDPAPAIWLSEYQSSSIQYVVRVWASTEEYWDMYYALLEEVREAFARHQVEMTYDHLNVHLVRPPRPPEEDLPSGQ